MNVTTISEMGTEENLFYSFLRAGELCQNKWLNISSFVSPVPLKDKELFSYETKLN